MQYSKRHCLVTGGAGYIGQHVVLALLQEGWRVTIYDNLCTSEPPCLETLWNLAFDTEKPPSFDPGYLAFHRGDIRDNVEVCRCLDNMTVPVTRVIHLAALKSIQESQQFPDLYVEVNLEGLLLHAADVPQSFQMYPQYTERLLGFRYPHFDRNSQTDALPP